MYHRREGFFQGSNKNKLFMQQWKNPQAKGTILITHGQGEHSECYHRLIHALEPEGWDFYAWDLRGHGRSEGKRGFANHTNEYVEDYKIFVQEILSEPDLKKRPVIFLSHSLGGLIQMKALIEDSTLSPLAQIYSAPLLGLSIEVPVVKKKASTVLNRWWPKVTLWNEIHYDQLTRDPDVIREYEADVLRHDRISPGVFIGMLETMEFLAQSASEVHGKILFQCPEEDPIVSTPQSRNVFARIGSHDKVFLSYGAGAKHELYNDINREEVFKDLRKFLKDLL